MNLRDRKHEHARSGISDLSVAQAAVADQATPGEDQIGVDVVPARDAGDRGSGLQALRHDPQLLFARPETATRRRLFARPETATLRATRDGDSSRDQRRSSRPETATLRATRDGDSSRDQRRSSRDQRRRRRLTQAGDFPGRAEIGVNHFAPWPRPSTTAPRTSPSCERHWRLSARREARRPTPAIVPAGSEWKRSPEAVDARLSTWREKPRGRCALMARNTPSAT